MTGYPGLIFSEVEGRLIAHFQPSPARPHGDADALRELLERSGYGGWFLFDDILTTLAARCNTENGAFELAVGERRDGSFELEIAPDAMSAWVALTPAQGGTAVTTEDLYAALDEAGVVFGIDKPALKTACDNASGGRVAVATGIPPQSGADARFEMLIADSRDRAPKVNAQGLVDFRELGAIPLVEAGQALMRRIPSTAGLEGRNIRGEILQPLPGHDVAFADHMVGACVADDDPNLLRAVFNGQPVYTGNAVTVEQVVHVKNVSVASGNISFDGTVHVDGEVLPGMKVHATGDIIVTGTVDNGDLDAGGNVQVAGGIIAHATVKAGGSVSARFVENSSIYAGTTIAIDDMALQSDLQAMNQIMIGIKSAKRGRLVGGSARAMMLIRTPLLGAANSGVTNVLVGVNPVLEAKYQELLLRIEKQKVDEDNLQKLVQQLGKLGDKKDMLERAKASWQRAVQTWAQLLPERDELEKQLALIENARVEVGIGVCGAVDLIFGKKVQRLRRNYDAGAFVTTDGRIVFVAPDGTATDAC